jgi:putative transposase
MRHNRLRLLAHFVWATQSRLPLITSDMERSLYPYIGQVCRRDGCLVHAIGGMPDHVHLLVSMGHDITTSDLMHHVKGGSSRFVNETFAPETPFHWQRGYGVFGVSPHDKARVMAYIYNQKQHHADGGILWPGAEQTDVS